ncbi:MAG: hypothetical protein CVV27_16860 [Candidatus Melainabacteria bacterium HGW-Melainabacteria-1]|nr:MAG: hypothetical protein CVV27_16860 [Candidatus Melainabacteria bacterium HGW-Melainabacteria-1]
MNKTTADKPKSTRLATPFRNALVDSLAGMLLALLTATGLILRVPLPPGSRGQAIWGLSRHAWGEFHFFIALALLAVMSLHLLLHWRWIACMLKGKRAEQSGLRLGLGALALLALLSMILLPLGMKQTPLESPRDQTSSESTESESKTKSDQVYGGMSLREFEQLTGVPVSYLQQQLRWPETPDPEARLGQLSRRYGFSLPRLRKLVEAWHQRPQSATPEPKPSR